MDVKRISDPETFRVDEDELRTDDEKTDGIGMGNPAQDAINRQVTERVEIIRAAELLDPQAMKGAEIAKLSNLDIQKLALKNNKAAQNTLKGKTDDDVPVVFDAFLEMATEAGAKRSDSSDLRHAFAPRQDAMPNADRAWEALQDRERNRWRQPLPSEQVRNDAAPPTGTADEAWEQMQNREHNRWKGK